MRILLSNDDGILAPGIQALASALREFADVKLVAPDRNRSGASNALTLDGPLRIQSYPNGDTAVINGTPTDCVYLGVNTLMRPRPDIVVSGINAGPNLGDDVIYSGTVAAAMEGRHLGTSSSGDHRIQASHPQRHVLAREESATPYISPASDYLDSVKLSQQAVMNMKARYL